MRKFFVDNLDKGMSTCSIKGQEARHIVKALRMRQGDKAILMDGKGLAYLASLIEVSPHEVKARLESTLEAPSHSPVEIHLCQAILKSKPMDYLIQKTTELGVDYIYPFNCKYSTIKFEQDRARNKTTHWHKISLAAAKQSGRFIPAVIEKPCSFNELLEKWSSQDIVKIILWEKEIEQDFKSILKSSRNTGRLVGLVGPEGGFDHNEIKLAKDADFIPISMGNRILRGETAGIALVTLAQYELGDLRLPFPLD